MNQDQKNSREKRPRRPVRRLWTLAALDRDVAYRLAYNVAANRWDVAEIGDVSE